MKRSCSERDDSAGDNRNSQKSAIEAEVLARQKLLAGQLSVASKLQLEKNSNNAHLATSTTTSRQQQQQLHASTTAKESSSSKQSFQDAAQNAVAAARARMGLPLEQKQEASKPTHTRPTALKRNLLANLTNASSAERSNTAKQRYATVQVEDFWSNLRSWNICREFQQMQQMEKADTPSQQQEPLPLTFQSHSHYVSSWAPLCLNEARAQLLAEISSDLQQQQIQKRLCHFLALGQPIRTDIGTHTDYVRIQIKLPIAEDAQAPPHRRAKTNTYNNAVMFKPNDVVLMFRKEEDLLDILSTKNANQTSASSATAEKRFMGIIGTCDNFRTGSPEGLVVKVSRHLWTTQFASSHSESYQQPKEGLCLLPLKANTVTSLREFHALCHVKGMSLLPVLLAGNDAQSTTAQHSMKKTKTELLQEMGGANALGSGFAAYAERKFNESQLEAISAAAKDYGKGGFTLVKGPPGTGKTTTLAALVNALHIKQFNKYYEELRRQATWKDSSASSTFSSKLSFQEISKHKPRILICAPSNAAVDNIIFKIMEDGFVDGKGCRYNPVMCRIGSGQSAAVEVVSLEAKVMSILEEGDDSSTVQQLTKECQAEITVAKKSILKLQRRANAILAASPWPLAQHYEIRIQEPFEQTNKVYFVNHKDKTTSTDLPPPPDSNQVQFPPSAMPEYRSYISQLVKLIEQYSNLSNTMERHNLISSCSASSDRNAKAILRQQVETHILDSVHIVLTTLGTAGSRALESAAKFEVVVVDEAAQSVEPATLPALQLGSSHAILVGDPQQLPATIFSISGKTTKYDRSLFQRLEEAGHKVHMLNVQYRMHPDISDFPRRIFYGGNLVDGPNVQAADYGNPLQLAITATFKSFRPFTILDLDSSEERGGGTSLSNSTEAKLALHLYQSLDKATSGMVFKSKVAVISPYAQQVNLLRRTFYAAFGDGYEERIEINTVDGFQGRESSIVIFSCVRASGSKGIGFLSDVRRMNVALTRAKHFLFVITRCKSIVVNPYWRDLVKHAREKRSILAVPIKSGKDQPLFSSLAEL